MTDNNGLAPVLALETRGICKNFGGFEAVKDVSIQVRHGSIHALIGPNGAGKTTCFNLLTRFLSCSSGRILFYGRDITRMKPAQVAKLGLVRSFQISAVFGSMTALENLRVALQLRHGHPMNFLRSERRLAQLDDVAMSLLAEVGLERHAHDQANTLSYGRKRALEVATTLAVEPKMLLLDEPLAGLGHEDIEQMAELIRHMAKDRAVLMVEHNLSVVASLSDRITVLARGQVLADGSYDEVSADPHVRSAYMGAAA